MYPTNDATLAGYLVTAAANGCKVRIKGTAHSYDGLVVQKTELSVLVISLAFYVPPTPWNNVLATGPNPSFRLGAGRTLLDLASIVRPQGYVLPTQTGGWFFSIGGIVSSPDVHGATFGAGRLAEQMTACRIMKADGTSVDITDSTELAAWRGSMGMLGIVTAVQIKLQQDTGIQLSYAELTPSTWSSSAVTNFLATEAASKHSLHVVYNPYNDQLQGLFRTTRVHAP